VLTSLQTGSPLSYLIAVIVPALDAVFPVLPSETVVIALGVTTAGSADPRIALLVGCAAAGAFLGDNLSYLIGHHFGNWAGRTFFAGPKGARRRAWAEGSLRRFGMQLIVVCRFIPGGRTAVTLTCGVIGYPRRRYLTATACAGILWASYAFFLGRLGGQLFEDKLWIGLLLGLGLGLAVSVLIEVGRRVWQWRTRAALGRRRGRPPGPRAEPAAQVEDRSATVGVTTRWPG